MIGYNLLIIFELINLFILKMKLSDSPERLLMPPSYEGRLSPQHSQMKQSKTFMQLMNCHKQSKKNLNEMSVKIDIMEKKFKNRDLFSSTDMGLSQNKGGLKFRKQKNDKPCKNQEKLIKPVKLTVDDLRGSLDDGLTFDFFHEDRQDKEERNVPNGLTDSLRMIVDVNPQAFLKGSARLKMSKEHNRLQIPRTSNQTLENNELSLQKHTNNNHMFTSQNLTSKLLNLKNNPKQTQVKNDVFKNRIQKSMQLISQLKSQELVKKRDKQILSPKKKTKQRVSTTINGFQIGEEVGKGKFGQVYLARHIKTNFIVALKKVKKQKIKQYNMIDQFIKQIKLHNIFDHPKIVKFYGFFQHQDSFYLIMEYMDGGTLFEYQNKVRKIPIKQTVQYLRDIIEALGQLHNRSIVHRDLKPQNIVLTSKGVAKLCDFGWAAVVNKSRKTYCGTLQYVSPQILNKKQYNTAVDIWSIGILTYEMLMGRAPFEDRDRNVIKSMIIEANHGSLVYDQAVPQQARQFIEWLIQKDPHCRPKVNQLLTHELFLKYAFSKSVRKI